jgi:uncharacterized protein (TIGR02145 family)
MKYLLSGLSTLIVFILLSSCNKDDDGINTGNPGTCDNAGITIDTRVSADTVFISPNGGIAPYAYSIDGSYFSLINTFTNLDMGSNNLYVQDSRGCIELSKVYVDYKSTVFDSRNNNTYKAVKIGNQVWMGENLIFPVAGQKECYDTNDDNCKKFGILYTWKNTVSACPTGYRLPSVADFNTLTDTLSKSGDTYGLLTSTGSNEFSAKLFGYKDNGFINLDKGTAFWTNEFTVSGADTLYTGFELSESNQVSFKNFSNSAALYVRCIRK